MSDLHSISFEEASVLLFKKCLEFILLDKKHELIKNKDIRILTQRLYGDYRQVSVTSEYKRAEKYANYYKSTGLGRELF